MYLSEEGAAGCMVAGQGSCLGAAGSHEFRQGRHVARLWGCCHTQAQDGTVPQQLVLEVQRAHSWKKTVLRAINYKDYLAPRICLLPSAGGRSNTQRISLQALSALTACLCQLLSATVKNRA